MSESTLFNFVASYYEDVVEAMLRADEDPIDAQYRLGIRKLAKDFFDKFDLFELEELFPDLQKRDVDAWFAGREEN